MSDSKPVTNICDLSGRFPGVHLNDDGTLLPFYGTFTQHYDAMTLKMSFRYITNQISQRILYLLMV